MSAWTLDRERYSMSANTKLAEEDIAWAKAYENEVREVFDEIFKATDNRFKDE